jgi:hypothetical protein
MESLLSYSPNDLHRIVCNCVIYNDKRVNSYYRTIIEYQRNAIHSFESRHKKEKVWTSFYLKRYLIKDIANIVSEY